MVTLKKGVYRDVLENVPRSWGIGKTLTLYLIFLYGKIQIFPKYKKALRMRGYDFSLIDFSKKGSQTLMLWFQNQYFWGYLIAIILRIATAFHVA